METYRLESKSALSVATLIARVEAGAPMSISSDFEKIDLNALFGGESSLLIRIRGESMSDEIQDGDWVIVDRARRPFQGQTVIAMLGDDYTIKKFEQDRRGLRLAPNNGDFPTRDISETDDFLIIGVVTAVIKPFVV